MFLVVSGMALLLGSTVFRSRERAFRPDLAREAREFLRANNVVPLSGELSAAAAKNERQHVATQPHPLLKVVAPSFELPDDQSDSFSLPRHNGKPLVLVFYFGYHCNHCVGQLFAIHDDIALFRECGADVWAISADAPADTRSQFKEYGRFAFPVLSDAGNAVAERFGVYFPSNGDTAERQLHGTFVLDTSGVIRWCNVSEEPFIDNSTLLRELIRLRDETNPSPSLSLNRSGKSAPSEDLK